MKIKNLWFLVLWCNQHKSSRVLKECVSVVWSMKGNFWLDRRGTNIQPDRLYINVWCCFPTRGVFNIQGITFESNRFFWSSSCIHPVKSIIFSSYFPIVFPLVLSLCSMLFNIKSENIQTLMVHQNLICYQPCRAKQTTSFNRFLLYFISFYSYHQGTKGQIPSGKSHFKNPRSPREVCPTF